MTAKVGSLNVDIGLETARFGKGLSQAQASMAKAAKNFARMGQQISGIGRTLSIGLTAPLAGVAAAFASTARTITGDTVEISRAAAAAGEGFEDFQRLAFAARSVNVEAGKLGDIFRDVRDKIGDFRATGGGEMADFFENIAPKVGLTADAFVGLSGREGLQLFYDSLERAGVSSDQMTFYLEAIASDATDLIPLLNEGGRAFDELGKKAAVLSEADAAGFREYAVASADMEQAFRKLTVAVVNSGLLEALTQIAQRVADWTANLAETNPAILRWGVGLSAVSAAIGPALLGVGAMVSALGTLGLRNLASTTAIKAFTASLGLQAAAVVSSARVMGGLSAAKLAVASAAAGAAGATRALTAVMIANPITSFALAIGTVSAALFTMSQRQREARAETAALINSLEGLAAARSSEFALRRDEAQIRLNQARDELTRLQIQRDGLRTSPELAQRTGATGRLQELNGRLAEQGLLVVELESKIKLADRAYRDAGQAAEQLVVPVGELSREFEGLGRSITGADTSTIADDFRSLMDRIYPEVARARQFREELDLLRESLAGGALAEAESRLRFDAAGESATGSVGLSDRVREALFGQGELGGLEEGLKSFERFTDRMKRDAESAKVTIVRTFGEMAELTLSAFDRLIGAIRGGGFLDILSGVIGFGLQLGRGGVFGKGVSGLLNSVPAFANGTSFAPGGISLVGERGPELVDLPRGARVTPNNQLGGMRQVEIHVVAGEMFDVRVEQGAAKIVGLAAPGIVNAATTQIYRNASRRLTPGGLTG